MATFDNMKLNLKGGELTLRNTELESKSVLKKLTGVYDEHAKIVFIFDVSGSMNSRVAKTYTEQYQWTPEILADVRARATVAIASLNALQSDPMALMSGQTLTEEESKLVTLADKDRRDDGIVTF